MPLTVGSQSRCTTSFRGAVVRVARVDGAVRCGGAPTPGASVCRAAGARSDGRAASLGGRRTRLRSGPEALRTEPGPDPRAFHRTGLVRTSVHSLLASV
ncbi:hypothetical protein ACH4VM_33465 [Streptomyces sp. NPDC020792]|uniref:hypothetical protein n=1 Tax=Streptomyces sp. NPDC020792 TaxID=3365089 RepID=UPI0037BC208B